MKLALLQLNSEADIDANIAAVEAMVREAAANGAELIATPENTFMMEASTRKDAPLLTSLRKQGDEYYVQENHPGVIAMQALAEEFRVWILLGSVAVLSSSHLMRGSITDDKMDTRVKPEYDKSYNRSLLINPQGDIAAAYDKIHLFDVDVPGDRSYRESDRFLAGDKAVVAGHESWVMGMTICYDVRFPQLYRALAKRGANIIAVPAAFTQVTGEAHWHVLLRARAIENGCFIIAPAQTGTHPGNRQTYGHSLVIDPWGRVVADGGTEVGIVYAEIDLAEVAKVRAKLPSLQHDMVIT